MACGIRASSLKANDANLRNLRPITLPRKARCNKTVSIQRMPDVSNGNRTPNRGPGIVRFAPPVCWPSLGTWGSVPLRAGTQVKRSHTPSCRHCAKERHTQLLRSDMPRVIPRERNNAKMLTKWAHGDPSTKGPHKGPSTQVARRGSLDKGPRRGSLDIDKGPRHLVTGGVLQRLARIFASRSPHSSPLHPLPH